MISLIPPTSYDFVEFEFDVRPFKEVHVRQQEITERREAVKANQDKWVLLKDYSDRAMRLGILKYLGNGPVYGLKIRGVRKPKEYPYRTLQSLAVGATIKLSKRESSGVNVDRADDESLLRNLQEVEELLENRKGELLLPLIL